MVGSGGAERENTAPKHSGLRSAAVNAKAPPFENPHTIVDDLTTFRQAS